MAEHVGQLLVRLRNGVLVCEQRAQELLRFWVFLKRSEEAGRAEYRATSSQSPLHDALYDGVNEPL